MRGMKSFAITLLALATPLTGLVAQQDPPREDCCAHIYNTGINLGWASSLMNHVVVPGVPDTGARAAVMRTFNEPPPTLTASRRACSEYNPIWVSSPNHETWLGQQAGRLGGPTRSASTDRSVQSALRDTYKWAEELGVGAIGRPTQRFELRTPSCDEGYFRLGWLFGYATQTLRMARGFRDQGRTDWSAAVEDARSYLRLAVEVLKDYDLSPRHANLGPAEPYLRLSRIIAAPPAFVDSMEQDMDQLWTLSQQAIATDCGVALPGRIDAPPSPGYCILRRPDLYQRKPGPPTCFEFYLADANVQDDSRMASIQGGSCGATYFAWRQGWRPDCPLPRAVSDVAGGGSGDDRAVPLWSRRLRVPGATGLGRVATATPARYPANSAAPSAGAAARHDRRQWRAGRRPSSPRRSRNTNGYNFDATFESTPVSLEIDPDAKRATVNGRIDFHMTSFNRALKILDEVTYTYLLSPGTGTAESASGKMTFTAVMKSNGRVTNQWSGELPWSAKRQADGSWTFDIENSIAGWYAPISYILR